MCVKTVSRKKPIVMRLWAREEAAAEGVAPIALTDAVGFARLCEEHDVAVIRARLPIAIPDVDLLEALRAS